MVRGPVSMVIVGVISLVMVALVAGGPAIFDRVLPASAVAFLNDFGMGGGMASMGGDGQRSGEFAADFLDDSTDGLKAEGPIAARSGNEPVFIAEVITGYTTRVGSDIPAEITTIRPILGCALTPPNPGTSVGHVAAGPSGVDLAMTTYNDTHLAAEVQTFVNVYRTTGTASAFVSDGPAYEVYDVTVTESREPVYLVLENRFGARIWNIHLAQGAQIERVILLGGAQSGVANLDPLVPVEVILDDGLAACGVQPAYALNEGHLFFQSMQNGAMPAEEAATKLAGLAAAEMAYDIWFRDTFGVGATESRVGWDAGTMALIGPVPGASDPKPVYAPIQGARIRLTQDKFFDLGGQVAEGAGFASRVRAIATTFAYGDLENLRQGVKF